MRSRVVHSKDYELCIHTFIELVIHQQQVYQFSHKSTRPVLRVEQTSDQRYTPTAGQYFHVNGGPSVETTYPVPQIASHNIYPHHHHRPQVVHLPLHRPLLLPNPLLKQNPFPLQSHHFQSFNGKGMEQVDAYSVHFYISRDRHGG